MPTDGELVQLVDAATAEAFRRAGPLVTCKRGCTHCCIGPFPVTQRDLERLANGWRSLALAEQERIAKRASEARQTLKEGFPGDWDSGIIRSAAEADVFDLSHPWLPCPVLDLESGTCELHAHRPIACRLHGPAIRLNGFPLQPCRLNYEGAEADAYRVDLTLPEAGESELTYIAWMTTPPPETPPPTTPDAP